jgi:DNA-binding MarR family transcriptional regulator
VNDAPQAKQPATNALSAAEILARPDFPSARDRHIDDMLELFGDKVLNRMIVEEARLFVSGLLIGLYATYREDDQSTWPTVGRIADSMSKLGLATPSRVNEMINRFIDTGYVTKDVSKIDGRVHILTPSQSLLAYDRAYIRALYRPLALLNPDSIYDPAINQDPRFHFVWRRIVFSQINLPATFFKRHPAIALFLHRDSGYTILLMALRTGMRGKQSERQFRTFSAIGERLGVSRTHVRKLLQEAQAAGLLRIERRGGGAYVPLPPLRRAFDLYVADLMANMDLIVRLSAFT